MQARVGHGIRLGERKPSCVRTFVGTWVRIVVAREQEIPHVVVPMPAGPRVHINMNQLRTIVRMRDGEAKFFMRFAHRSHSGFFSGIDMPTGLQPQAKSFVQVQHHAPLAYHDCRSGDMTNIAVFVERVRERRHHRNELGD